MPNKNQKQIAIWLFACCFMVFVMVVVGGYTRLTDSGLSIVEWKPVTGAIPPANEHEWEEEFDKYKSSPEFKKVNFDFSLSEFKKIYWVEYTHRLLGRIAGLIFFIPFMFFWIRGGLDKKAVIKLAGIFSLGGIQGFMGWYMVSSGLLDTPDVSHYRLTIHLILALAIYSFIFCVALGYLQVKDSSNPKLRNFSLFITAVIFVQIAYGGLVAGLNAGLVYNTFPLMDGELVPSGLFALFPWYMNFTENILTVQFAHRLLAVIISILVAVFWLKCRKNTTSGGIILASNILLVALCTQVALGIITLIYEVPLVFAVMHQGFAVVFLSVSLFINCQLCVKVVH